MTLKIENANPAILQIIKALKSVKSDLKITKISAPKPNAAMLKAMQETEQIIKDIRAGKKEPYDSFEEAKKAAGL